MEIENSKPPRGDKRWLVCLGVTLFAVLNAEQSDHAAFDVFFPFSAGTVLTFDGPVESGQTWYLDRVSAEENYQVYHFWVVERDVSGKIPSWKLTRPQVLRVSDERVYLDELCLLRQPVRVGTSCTSNWGQDVRSEVTEATPEWAVVDVKRVARDRRVAAKLLVRYVIAPGYGITGFHFAVGGELGWQERYSLTGVGTVVAGPRPSLVPFWEPEMIWRKVERRVRPMEW